MKKFRKVICLITALAAVMTALPTVGFSAAVSGYISCGVPELKPWIERNASGGEPDAKFVLDGTERYSGSYSAKIEYYSAPQSNMQFRLCKTAPATVGKSYRLGFMAKAENAEDVKITINSVGAWKNLTRSYGTTFDWKLIEFEFEFTREYFNEMEFIVASWAKCGGFWIDDLYVYELEDGKTVGDNLFKNPGFEDIGTEIPYMGEGATVTDEYDDHDTTAQMASKDAVLLNEAKNITIDGDPSDWADYTAYDITSYIPMVGFEEREVTLEADIRYAYDDESFYFLISTEDDTHVADESGKFWNGDSIQMAIDNNNANGYGQPFAVILGEDEQTTRLYDGTSLAEMNIEKQKGIETVAKRDGTKTYYEFKITWSQLGIEKPADFKYCVMINDNDGDGRKGWLELATGISDNRSLRAYPRLYIERNDYQGEITATVDQEGDVDVNADRKYKLYLKNITERDLDLEISGDMTADVTIPSGFAYTYYIDKTFTEYGDGVVSVHVKDKATGEVRDFDLTLTVIPTEDTYAGLIAEARRWTSELEALVKKCEKRKIEIPYEYARYEIVKFFTKYMQDEYDDYKAFYRIGHYYTTLKDIYRELKPQLNDILSGKTKPLECETHVSGVYYDYSDAHYYGTRLRGGKLVREPVLLMGYQSFQTDDDFDEMATAFGQNTVSIGYYITDFVKPENGQYVRRGRDEVPVWRTKSPTIELEEKLQKYEKMGVSVYVGFFESYDRSLAADMQEAGKDYYSFMSFNPTHELIFKQTELAVESVLPIINKYDCVTSIMVFNEPSYYSYDKEFYKDEWIEFLTERYSTVEELNRVYKSEYKDFSEVERSEKDTHDVRFNDYRDFNDSILEEYYDFCRKEIRKYNKDIPIWTKEMMPTRNYGGAKTAGANIENLAQYFDLNGNDSFAFWDNANFPLAAKMEWYDIQTSVLNAPVVNGENHIISDDGMKKLNYDTHYDYHYAADVWEGMLHGAGLSEQWMFSRWDSSLKNYGQTSLLFRPATLDKTAKTTLDVHRLTPEIIAIQDKKREVGILYSDMSWSFNGQFMNAMYEAYTSLLYQGQRAGFVFESQLEKADGYKLIVVPACTNVSEETLSTLDEFVQNGGKLLIIGDESLRYNAKGDPHDAETLARIYQNAVVVNAEIDVSSAMITIDGDLDGEVEKLLTELKLNDVKLVDAETGKRCDEVEALYAEVDGRLVINLCNYTWDGSKRVDIYFGGEKVTSMKELRNNADVNGTIELEPFEPVMVEIER